jgi:4-amino-4-deoxy-L-arabinose transferase-like glycosyltransferase
MWEEWCGCRRCSPLSTPAREGTLDRAGSFFPVSVNAEILPMDLSRSEPYSKPEPRPGAWLLVLGAIAALLFFWDLQGLGFLDNEGRYAEVAREMLRTGDWITPHLNGEVFLNKPPLVFWLTALGFLGGMTESVRWVSGAATLATLLIIYDLGNRSWSPRAGLWAAAVYLTSALTVIEARTLRPEPFLALFLCLTLWGAVRVAEHQRGRDPGGGRWGPAALWAGVGLGIMAKGFLSLALPFIALAPALFLSGQLRGCRHRYAPGWGLALTALLVLPWHAAAGLRNEGFWWDYVVNQHLLVFFDRKFPRDHVPDPLWRAWAMFALRLFPWLFLLPAAIRRQLRRARATRSVTEWLPLTWLGSIFLFFSLSSGRLEHYFIPAVPAAALLVGGYCDAWARYPGARTWRRYLPFSMILAVGLAGLAVGPLVLRWTGALTLVPALLPLAFTAIGAVTLAGAVSTTLIGLRRPVPALLAVVLSFLVFAGCAARALGEINALTSARYVIRRLAPRLLAESEIAYEAGDEYQLCGVLNFYLGRRVLLPEPPGFVPPTYLKRYVSRLFVNRAQFRRDWARGERRYLLFTNPEKPLDRRAEFPQPFYEVARGGGRQVITNKPLPR